MLCIFFTLFFFYFFRILTLFVFTFPYNLTPMAPFCTIETFIEIGIFLPLILAKIFRNHTVIKVTSIIIIIALEVISMFILYSTLDIPILTPIITGMYLKIYNFFEIILDKISNFILGT